jgi:hypothetical protein
MLGDLGRLGHYTSGEWQLLTEQSDVLAMAMDGEGTLLGVGYNGLYLWNDGQWRLDLASSRFWKVLLTAGRDVIAVGDHRILHRQGHRWIELAADDLVPYATHVTACAGSVADVLYLLKEESYLVYQAGAGLVGEWDYAGAFPADVPPVVTCGLDGPDGILVGTTFPGHVLRLVPVPGGGSEWETIAGPIGDHIAALGSAEDGLLLAILTRPGRIYSYPLSAGDR